MNTTPSPPTPKCLAAVDVYIVVAASLHLDERYLLLFGAHAVDIHKLDVALAVLGTQRARKSVGCIDARQAGYRESHRFATETHVVFRRYPALGRRAYQQTDFSARKQVERRLAAAVAYLIDDGDFHTGFSYNFARTRRRIQLIAQLAEFLGDLCDLGFIDVADRDQHSAAVLAVHIVTGGAKTLVERFVKTLSYTEHLAGGLHLRTEMSIEIGELFKAEYGHFDRYKVPCRSRDRAVFCRACTPSRAVS